MDERYVTCETCEAKHGAVVETLRTLHERQASTDDKMDRKFDKLGYTLLAGVALIALNLGLVLFQVISNRGTP